ncbi:histidine kinase [Paenibacillus algorifonticola]
MMELATLRAGIKPHFLFNEIGPIILISKRNTEEARALLATQLE